MRKTASRYFLCFICIIVSTSTQGQELGILIQNGPQDRRLNIVLLSEGYTATELDAFRVTAQQIVENLFGEEPFLSYRQYFNAYTISIASNESGADIPSENVEVDTAFDATFGSSGISRLLTVRGSKVSNVLLDHFPNWDIVLVVVNTDRYGGSGGGYAVTSTNTNAFEIAEHELGHSFGYLADEYETTSSLNPIESPNVTAETERESIKWKHWIEDDTEIPTPELSSYSGIVGLYEGAMYRSEDWYRPHYNSKMRNLNRPWGQVNSEQLVFRMYEALDLFRGATPSNEDTISINDNLPKQFVLNSLLPNGSGTLVYEWFIDGVIVSSGESSFTLDPSLYQNGNYSLQVRVADRTDLVRLDPNELLFQEQMWSVQIEVPLSGSENYESWSTNYIPDPDSRGELTDIDGDTLPNIAEFFLGSNPTEPNDANQAIVYEFYLQELVPHHKIEIFRQDDTPNANLSLDVSTIGDQWKNVATISPLEAITDWPTLSVDNNRISILFPYSSEYNLDTSPHAIRLRIEKGDL